MSVLKYLDLSTGHISSETVKMLNAPHQHRRDAGWPTMLIVEYEYGWFITVPIAEEIKEAKVKVALGQFPADLANLLWYAHEKRCNLIRLDGTSSYTADLQEYDW